MLIVRCPACNTVFRVRPEQLRTHAGRVRCGNCYRPFNAVENLMDQGDGPSPGIEPQTAMPAPAADSAQPEEGLLEFGIPDDFLSWARTPAASPHQGSSGSSWTEQAESSAEAAPKSASRQRLEPVIHQDPPQPEDLTHPADEPATPPLHAYAYANPFAEPDPDLDVPTEPIADPGQPAATAESEPDSDPIDEDTDFPEEGQASGESIADAVRASAAAPHTPAGLPPMHAASGEAPVGILRPTGKEHADWRREENGFYPDWLAEDNAAGGRSSRQQGGRRWLWGLVLGILAGTLAAQAAYLFRQEIARKWPDTRPYYLELCAQLGCTVPLPRIASAISIESSNLESDPGTPTRFILIARVRNLAPHPLQHPHLELTLTDTRDRPVVRRVITPDEWVPGSAGSSATPESAQFPARSDIEVSVPFRTAGTIGAVGYRLYAFYP